ncbi:hypothetical protein KFK09_010435 [Dendrobium nobile]|uniref:Uncharacterized protein n=1 Tax=Dendrobium nobile TaxID=94219 RepID=A0A8T3BFM4_DENNO|nr:hypothetical protein KFK09_010435 [Dendrobium nobile]
MAELLRLDSTKLYGNNSQGCIWGLFHVFDSYQRRENKRMLSYRRLGVRQYGIGTDILISNDEAGSGEDNITDKGAINIVSGKKKTHDIKLIRRRSPVPTRSGHGNGWTGQSNNLQHSEFRWEVNQRIQLIWCCQANI